MNHSSATILETVETLCNRYHITALEHFLESCRAFAAEMTLSVAILGRFKTGKSSLLNQLIGRDLLPVGVTPVTAVVTEVRYGPQERAEVHFLDGRIDVARLESIGEFITEAGNPENTKRVSRLASQWEDVITSQLQSLEEESLQRLNGFISTVEALIGSTANGAPGIRSDIGELERLQKLLVQMELES